MANRIADIDKIFRSHGINTLTDDDNKFTAIFSILNERIENLWLSFAYYYSYSIVYLTVRERYQQFDYETRNKYYKLANIQETYIYVELSNLIENNNKGITIQNFISFVVQLLNFNNTTSKAITGIKKDLKRIKFEIKKIIKAYKIKRIKHLNIFDEIPKKRKQIFAHIDFDYSEFEVKYFDLFKAFYIIYNFIYEFTIISDLKIIEKRFDDKLILKNIKQLTSIETLNFFYKNITLNISNCMSEIDEQFKGIDISKITPHIKEQVTTIIDEISKLD